MLIRWPFKRKAFPPLFIEANYQPFSFINAGLYFGFEHELQSGTLIGFEGPVTSFVYGAHVNFFFTFIKKIDWFDPYVGISYYRYILVFVPPGEALGFRLGSNFHFNKYWGANMNVGVGAALGEIGIIYKLSLHLNKQQ